MVIMGFASRNSKDMQGMQGPDQMISNEILGFFHITWYGLVTLVTIVFGCS